MHVLLSENNTQTLLFGINILVFCLLWFTWRGSLLGPACRWWPKMSKRHQQDSSMGWHRQYWDLLGTGTSSQDTDKWGKRTPETLMVDNKTRSTWFYQGESYSHTHTPAKVELIPREQEYERSPNLSSPGNLCQLWQNENSVCGRHWCRGEVSMSERKDLVVAVGN